MAAARRRIASRRNWPANLRVNAQGYYSYQQPGTGKSFGLGKDFKIACDEVRTVNAEMERKKGHVTLLQRVNGGHTTLAEWCKTYESTRLVGNKHTTTAMQSQLRAIAKAPFAVQNMMDIKPKELADFVKECVDSRGATMAANIRRRLAELFREAISHGIIEVGKNPVDSILKPVAKVTRARLTLAEFQLIVNKARADKEREWAANALELALVTGQRREDIAKARFEHVKDGFLWIEQGKTGKQLKIPVALRLDAAGLSLDELIRRCRDNVLAKNLVHFVKRNGNAVPGGPVKPMTLTQMFSKLRDEVMLDGKLKVAADKTPPSFHEIRSLAARLYTEQYGKEFAQALLGHKSESMTDLYRDIRGREWTEIKIVGER